MPKPKTDYKFPITLETTIDNARKWLNIIRYGESGTVIQLQDDCVFRVLDIINNRKILKQILGPYYKKYILKFISIDERDLNKTLKDELIQLCIERKIGTKGILNKFTNEEILKEIGDKGYDVGLFITHINPLFINRYFQPLYDLELLIRTSKNLAIIVFTEVDITHEKFKTLVYKASFLFDHIIKYPLYDEADCRQFVNYYSQKWNFSLPDMAIREIIQTCGGYLWLIHHALRNLRDNPTINISEAASDELMVEKLEAIWTKFTNEEKNILCKVYNNNFRNIDTFTHEYNYLKAIKVINGPEIKPSLGIPIFSHVIEKLNSLSEKNDYIYSGGKDISQFLTIKEKAILLLLLKAKKRVVSRDTIARTIWDKDWEDKYSDWAIDRLSHRLRKKLLTLGIDEKHLKTLKKKGFIWE